MKYFLTVVILSLFSLSLFVYFGQENPRYEVIGIYASLGNEENIVGMGVLVDDEVILTSAHVVGDDRYSYAFKKNGQYTILHTQEKDTARDVAWMTRIGGPQLIPERYKSPLERARYRVRKGDLVYALVSGSGRILRREGRVTHPLGRVLGYSSNGQTEIHSGVVLTDIDVLPGDSGAPIFTSSDNLIDVVHVMGK